MKNNKWMRTLLCVVLVLLLTTALFAGCGGQEGTENTDAPDNTEAALPEIDTTQENDDGDATESDLPDETQPGAASQSDVVEDYDESTASDTGSEAEDAPSEAEDNDATASDLEGTETPVTELGTGAKTFYLTITVSDGTTSSYTVHTDAENVGAALLENNLVDPGDNGYYTTVLGETLDWATTQMYWAFYIDGEYAMTGLDDTAVVDGASYSLTATAG